jgi:hypothetical protein
MSADQTIEKLARTVLQLGYNSLDGSTSVKFLSEVAGFQINMVRPRLEEVEFGGVDVRKFLQEAKTGGVARLGTRKKRGIAYFTAEISADPKKANVADDLLSDVKRLPSPPLGFEAYDTFYIKNGTHVVKSAKVGGVIYVNDSVSDLHEFRLELARDWTKSKGAIVRMEGGDLRAESFESWMRSVVDGNVAVIPTEYLAIFDLPKLAAEHEKLKQAYYAYVLYKNNFVRLKCSNLDRSLVLFVTKRDEKAVVAYRHEKAMSDRSCADTSSYVDSSLFILGHGTLTSVLDRSYMLCIEKGEIRINDRLCVVSTAKEQKSESVSSACRPLRTIDLKKSVEAVESPLGEWSVHLLDNRRDPTDEGWRLSLCGFFDDPPAPQVFARPTILNSVIAEGSRPLPRHGSGTRNDPKNLGKKSPNADAIPLERRSGNLDEDSPPLLPRHAMSTSL